MFLFLFDDCLEPAVAATPVTSSQPVDLPEDNAEKEVQQPLEETKQSLDATEAKQPTAASSEPDYLLESATPVQATESSPLAYSESVANPDVSEPFDDTDAGRPIQLAEDEPIDASQVDPASGKPSLRVYTDTTESAPQVDTDVQETEEVLPDGTIVRRRVTTTQQRHLVSTRVVVEGPEDALPSSREEAERLFGEVGAGVPAALTEASDAVPETKVSSDVQEFEETLEDGTVVKRRVITTTRHQLTTEKVFIGEPEDIPAGT